MTALGPELIPEGVTLAEALPQLGLLAALFFVLGCIYVLDGFTRALFSTAERAVGWIPFLGHVVTAPIHRIEQKISNSLGNAERYFDNKIGAAFHKLALLTHRLGHQIEALARRAWMISGYLLKFPTHGMMRAFVKALVHPIRTAQRIERALLRAEHAAVRVLHHAYADVLLPRVHGAEHAIERVLYPDIAGLRARARTIEDRLARLRAWVRAHEKLVVSAAFVGAVAYALRKLGLGWLRCRNVKRVGRALCGLPVNLLEDLLAIGLAVEVIVDPLLVARVANEEVDTFSWLLHKIADPKTAP